MTTSDYPAPPSVARERAVYRTQYKGNGIVVKVLQRQIDTVRSSRCPRHNKSSSSYQGENEYGWIFRCPGLSETEAMGKTEPMGQWHYFVASPAPEVRKLDWDSLPKEIKKE